MNTIWVYYYGFLMAALVVAATYYLMFGIIGNPNSSEHYIGVNLTKHDSNCRITWLGGWDFDSFYTNVTVNGVNVGHPSPMTVIYNDTCKDVVVKMHDRVVRSDIELYSYNNSGGM
jgi:hypothetical protein